MGTAAMYQRSVKDGEGWRKNVIPEEIADKRFPYLALCNDWESERAWLVEFYDGLRYWFPKSLACISNGCVFAPNWLRPLPAWPHHYKEKLT